MKTKKNVLILFVTIILSSLCLFTACVDNKDVGGAKTYIMEAEYIDLDDVIGAGLSSEQSGCDMIYGTGTLEEKDKGWSNGYYVGYTYSADLTLNFVFTADVAKTATIILRLGSELGDITLSPSSLSVKLNGNSVNYSSMYVENSTMDTMKFYDKTLTTNASLKEGENTLSLTVLTNSLRSGQTGGPIIDCVKIQTSAVLTWTDKTANPSKRGEI